MQTKGNTIGIGITVFKDFEVRESSKQKEKQE